MSNLITRLETLWCKHMHDATMWPIHGRYRCATCLREYPVPFGDAGPDDGAVNLVLYPARSPRAI